jgi:glycosyltransferase involved in cell wall biosynthesis
MKVSVIIPVYNAENYVKYAVESALKQEETEEILLIEDGSPDNSLQVCRELAEKYDSVILYRHPDRGNHGAGETRNLGIKKASCEYIAFLDADDFYLPERFKVAKKLFSEKKEIDGVYEAIGVHFEDTAAEKIWAMRGGGNLTILTERVEPEDLFEFMLKNDSGTFSLDGLVVKRKIFEKCGYFFKNLRLHQDTAMNYQMSVFGRLYPGRMNEPVAMRRVHANNRFLSSYNKTYTHYLLWQTLFRWAKQCRLHKTKTSKLYINYQYRALRLAFMKNAGGKAGYQYLLTFLSETVKNYTMACNLIRYFTKKLLLKLK